MAASGDTDGRDSWRVGEIARATGLTVRTLHHYDEIGLLVAGRTSSGHRVYVRDHLERLYRISVLKQFGLGLDQIAAALDDPAWNLRDALDRHVRGLERRLVRTERLRQRLADTLAHLTAANGPGLSTDAGRREVTDLLAALKEMSMLDTDVTRRIAILVYADIAQAYDHLIDVLGLSPGTIEFDDAGTAVHAEVRAGDGVIWLHRVSAEWRLASPLTVGAATAMLAVTVEDVDAHHARALAAGADIVYAPVDQPYGVREYAVRGPEQELWSFMTPLD